jgi:ubiquinone/menaquinone biosynthesis C-methylase UbiE
MKWTTNPSTATACIIWSTKWGFWACSAIGAADTGQIARYLHRKGVTIILGVDLSAGMVAEAQRLNPETPFHQGNMLALPEPDNAWGGIAAFYCLIHIPRGRIVEALSEMKRVLKPGGVCLIADLLSSKRFSAKCETRLQFLKCLPPL